MSARLQLLDESWRHRVAEAVTFLVAQGYTGKVGLVLGSGLGNFVDAVDDAQALDYGEIPGFHAPTVAMHSGRLVCGQAAGVPVIVMQGRLHPYEGLPFAELLLPTAVLACLGIDIAVVTNAAGGLNRHYVPGDLMAIRDHVDLHFHDPLRGLLTEPYRPAGAPDVPPEHVARLAAIGRTPGLPHLYDPRLARLLVQARLLVAFPCTAAPTPACTVRRSRRRPRSACCAASAVTRWACPRLRKRCC